MKETTPTDSGVTLQRMGVEVAPDDPRSAEEILNTINRRRIQTNIDTEPSATRRAAMAAFALNTYPLPSDKE